MMNKDKILLKYYLKIWKELPEYPTRLDTLYELELMDGSKTKFLKVISKLNKQLRDNILINVEWLLTNGHLEETRKNQYIFKKEIKL